MALTKKDEMKVILKVYGWLCLVVGAAMLVVGILAWSSGSSAVATINQGLVDQKVYFPASGSPMFSASVFPDAQSYAGKQVVDGPTAQVYATDFLGPEIKLVGGGKTLSEITAAAAAAPTNAGLQQLQALMFQLNTSQTLMLADGYGAWSQGMMIQNVGMIMAVVGGLLLLVSAAKLMMSMKK